MPAPPGETIGSMARTPEIVAGGGACIVSFRAGGGSSCRVRLRSAPVVGSK